MLNVLEPTTSLQIFFKIILLSVSNWHISIRIADATFVWDSDMNGLVWPLGKLIGNLRKSLREASLHGTVWPGSPSEGGNL